jgi:hypothetical protein
VIKPEIQPILKAETTSDRTINNAPPPQSTPNGDKYAIIQVLLKKFLVKLLSLKFLSTYYYSLFVGTSKRKTNLQVT